MPRPHVAARSGDKKGSQTPRCTGGMTPARQGRGTQLHQRRRCTACRALPRRAEKELKEERATRARDAADSVMPIRAYRKTGAIIIRPPRLRGEVVRALRKVRRCGKRRCEAKDMYRHAARAAVPASERCRRAAAQRRAGATDRPSASVPCDIRASAAEVMRRCAGVVETHVAMTTVLL